MRLSYTVKSALCALLLLFAVYALAEVEITLSADPAEVVVLGDITISLTIVNDTEDDLLNAFLVSEDGTEAEPIGYVHAGETQTLMRTHSVTQRELDRGSIRCRIVYDDPENEGEQRSQQVSAEIRRISEAPAVTLTRQISSRYIVSGETVTVTYKAINTGNAPLSGLVLTDPLGGFSGRLEALSVGESKTFINRVKVDEAVFSMPELVCSAPSGTAVRAKLESAQIGLAESDVRADFSVRKNGDTLADARLTLTNGGNTDFYDITVRDNVYGGLIADAITLPAGGEPVSVEYTYPLRGETRCCWEITGRGESGETLEMLTQEMTFPSGSENGSIEMELDAEPRLPHISRAGYVTFDIRIRNSGERPAKNVFLYEVNRGEIRQLAIVDTDQPMECSVQYHVSENQEFFFCLNYADENDHVRTITAQPITIQVGKGGEPPETAADNGLNLGSDAVEFRSPSTINYSLIALFAFVIVLAVALLLTSGRLRRPQRPSSSRHREKKKAT